MPFSLTYIAIAGLTWLGVDNAKEVVEAIIIIALAVAGFYGRYRVGGVNLFGVKN